MSFKRVIPVLLLKGEGLYKTTAFNNPNYLGDPRNIIKIFNEKCADEICLLDIEATHIGEGPNFKLISELASEAFMPLSYGGGVRSLNDIKTLFSIGVEKVIINTACFESFSLIKEASTIYGGQSLVVSIDVKNNLFRKQVVMSHSGKVKQKIGLSEYLQSLKNIDIGEIIVTSIDREGSMRGMDLDLLSFVAQNTEVPVIGVGGVGSLKDIKTAFETTGINGVGVGSFFVYHGKEKGILITYSNDV